MTETLPVRYCHGCEAHDDHPRVVYCPADSNEPFLYHYDCLPEGFQVDEPKAPIVAACAGGVKGAKLRAFAEQHAQSLEA